MNTSIILVIITGILIVIIRRSCAENGYDESTEPNDVELNACCPDDARVQTAYECNDTSSTRVPDCDGSKILLKRGMFNIESTENSTFLFGLVEDKSGKIHTIFLPASKFCVSPKPRTIYPIVPINTAAVVCLDLKVKYPTFLYVILFLNGGSMIAGLLTCLLYSTLPPLQDSHGGVAFHFGLAWSVFHASIVYKFAVLLLDLNSNDANVCFVNLYTQIYITLAVFTWSLILSFDTWAQWRVSQNSNQRLRSIIYKCIGYGLPATLVLIGSLHAHIKHIDDDLKLAQLCRTHGKVLSEIYVVTPACVTLIANIGFIVSSQLEMSRIRRNEPSRRSIRGINYRVCMSFKLLILTGIPLLMGVIFLTFFKVFNIGVSTVTAIIGLCLTVAISCEGIIIFSIMVVFRKRVLRAIGQSGLLSCHFATSTWKNLVDSESDEDNVVVQDGIE